VIGEEELQMSRRTLLVAGCLAVLLGGIAWLRALAQPLPGTDEQQILAQIQQGKHAAELLSSSGLMRFVSGEYKDENGITRPVLGYRVREQFKESRGLEVTIPTDQIRIQVDPARREALSTFPLELRFLDEQGGVHPYSMNPSLHWRKERVRRFLVFPLEMWRVTRADGITGLTD
jgi:hypothetical protein